METVLYVDFNGVFVQTAHISYISADGKTRFRIRCKPDHSLHVRDYVEAFSSDLLHNANTASSNSPPTENGNFDGMISELLQKIRKRANERADEPAERTITHLKLFLSCHPNPENDKKFVAEAYKAGFSSVQVCSLATAILSTISARCCLPTVLLVYLRGTTTELSLVTFRGASPAILYTETVPLGIVQFSNTAMEKFQRDPYEWRPSKEQLETLFMNHFYPLSPQDKKTETPWGGQKRHGSASDFIRSLLQSEFSNLADELNQLLLSKITGFQREDPHLKVMVVPEQLRALLAKASDAPTLSSRYESCNYDRFTYITELCKATLLSIGASLATGVKTPQIMYEVYHPIPNVTAKEGTNVLKAVPWVSTLMTANDLTKPQLSDLAVCRNIFPFQSTPETFGARYAKNKLGRVIDVRLVQPNCIVTKTAPNTAFGIKGFDIYKLESGGQIKKQFSLTFPVESDVRTLIPNGWKNLYVAKDDAGFSISRVQNGESSMVCRWSGRYPSWYQWTSADRLAWQIDTEMFIADVGNLDCKPVRFILDYKIMNMTWKLLYEANVRGGFMWILSAKRFQFDQYGYPKSEGCVTIFAKFKVEHTFAINATDNSSVFACTPLVETQYLSLALVMQQDDDKEYYLKRIGILISESTEGHGNFTNTDVKETVFWSTSFTLGEHDEPTAVHESTSYGLLLVVTSHNVIFAFLTSNGQMLFRYVGTENFVKDSCVLRDGKDDDLVISTQCNQVFSVKFDAEALCAKALHIGETRFALDLMTTFQMRRTQEMFSATLSHMLPCDNWEYVANAIKCVDEVRHVELLRCFIEKFPDTINVPEILTMMWNEYSLTELGDILSLFVGIQYTPGAKRFLETVCRSKDEGILSCKNLLQSCVQAASALSLTSMFLKLLQLICSNNPTFLPLNIMDILEEHDAVAILSYSEILEKADLCSLFVNALAERKENEFLLELLKCTDGQRYWKLLFAQESFFLRLEFFDNKNCKQFEILRRNALKNIFSMTMSDHGIIALLNYDAKHELLGVALLQLTGITAAVQTRIAKAIFDHARFDELIDWLKMYPTCINDELATKIAIALVDSEVHGTLFERFTSICWQFSLEEVIEAAALSPGLTDAAWSIISDLCLVRKKVENALIILNKYPEASKRFGCQLLIELRATKNDFDIPWLKLAEYYDTVPNTVLRTEAMAFLKRKAPDAVAFIYSKRCSYDEFRTILAETRPQSQPETGDCVICLDVKADCVYIPCGHVASCLNCAERISACPLCRTECTAKHKIYLP